MLEDLVAAQGELGKHSPGSLIKALARAGYPTYPRVNGQDIPFVNVVTSMPMGTPGQPFSAVAGKTIWDSAIQADADLYSLCAQLNQHNIVNCRITTDYNVVPSRRNCSAIRDAYVTYSNFPPLPPLPFGHISIARKMACVPANDADGWAQISDIVVSTAAQSMETIFGRTPRLKVLIQKDIPHSTGIFGDLKGQPDHAELVIEALSAPPAGDLNGDGDINIDDVRMLTAKLGSIGNAEYDFNEDDIISVLDIRILINSCDKARPD